MRVHCFIDLCPTDHLHQKVANLMVEEKEKTE